MELCSSCVACKRLDPIEIFLFQYFKVALHGNHVLKLSGMWSLSSFQAVCCLQHSEQSNWFGSINKASLIVEMQCGLLIRPVSAYRARAPQNDVSEENMALLMASMKPSPDSHPVFDLTEPTHEVRLRDSQL